ncbi:putative bifunctional diguanylate cyclase/phosphodiesterase [Roseibium alexandrii]|uniref:Bacteriophytochrome cph2 n=1 Tax=Roseibium alexandrii TaxID=388408 RepID=A0A0M7AP03_9HYPH|nr:bifunctional diguanylate cyclase/phosphodiesterase [Roseibium alexandrii]CTQ76162.1 Bacteriophytochrome cph2 [Roseibium alexandrii]
MIRWIFRLPRQLGFYGGLLGLAVALALIAFAYNETQNQARLNTIAAYEKDVRAAYVALSDLQRLQAAILRALNEDNMTEASRANVQTAVDMLFVRADTMRVASAARNQTIYLPLVDNLSEVVELVDTALKEKDSSRLTGDAVVTMERARGTAIQIIDTLRRLHDAVMRAHTSSVKTRNFAVVASAALFLMLGLVLLTMLRREIFLRKTRERAEQRAEFLTVHDPLTGLINRGHFSDQVSAYLKAGKSSTFIMIDLDRFKWINDRLGHEAGDAVLRSVGDELLKSVRRHGGAAARFGGDEFAAWLPGEDTQLAENFCIELLKSFEIPIRFGDTFISIRMSFGVATTQNARTKQSLSFDDMMKFADFALYISKENGRGVYTIYDEKLDEHLEERTAFLSDLHQDVSQGDIDYHFQPKIQMDTGKIYGFEALARWRRNGEIISPDIFILRAEEAGFVSKIDVLVLDNAVREIAAWNTAYGTKYEISINISALNLAGQMVFDIVNEVLERYEFPAPLLTLEITESAELSSWDLVGQHLGKLREIGCRIAIDDFGIGYSSLAYLRHLEADEIKIDKSLVQQVETSEQAQFIIGSILELARTYLDFNVVVEGVENEAQAVKLSEIGCQKAQGFFYGKPRPAREALRSATKNHQCLGPVTTRSRG